MRNLKKAIGVLLMGASLTFLPVAHAEIMTYEGTGEYIMSDFETPDIAKQRAKVRAEQHAAEQAGVYVKSYTKTVNHVVESDEVTAIANTIIKIVDEKYTVTPTNENGGSFRVQVTIKAIIDSERIDEWLKNEQQKNNELIEQNKRLMREREKQEKEIRDLRYKLSVATNEQSRKVVEKSIAKEDRKFLSLKKTEEGDRLCSIGKYIEAIESYTRAININSDNEIAYGNRAYAYYHIGERKLAFRDIDKAIELNAKEEMAYYNRGTMYFEDGRYQEAINDFSMALRLKPKYSEAYYNRGCAYKALGNYSLAIADFSKSIEINPRKGEAYFNRGNSYAIQKNYSLAIADFNKSIDINPKNIDVYRNRGNAYYIIEDYKMAIKDYTKVLSMNDNDYRTYYFRGMAYNKLGETLLANRDFAKSKALRG